MGNYGIKVSKEGKSIDSNDSRDLLMSSKYPMFKYHDVQSSSFTFVPGDSEKFADVSHNLGYVPAFIAYMQDLNDTSKLMFMMSPPPTDFGLAPFAYADSAKIRIGLALLGFLYNQVNQFYSDRWETHFSSNTFFEIGNRSDLGFTQEGAYRFTNITIAQGTTITSAVLSSYVSFKGTSSSNTKVKIYGILETNTASFSSSPMSRTKTTAFTSENVALPSTGQYSNHDVTTQLQEIINQAGWAYGNAAGFIFLNDSSPSDAWWQDSSGGSTSHLTVTFGGNTTINFKVIIFKDKIA